MDGGGIREVAVRAGRLLRVGGREHDRLLGQVRRLQELNDSLGERLVAMEAERAAPPATRPASEDLRYLFVLTYGRSGSTLVQGVLNDIPGYVLRGENGGVLHHLHDVHTRLASARDRFGPAALPAHPWYGVGGYDDAAAYAAIRGLVVDLMLRPGADTRVTGFKEIRWAGLETAAGRDPGAHLDFVRSVFPGARFVVNTRDLERAAVSGFWRDRPDAQAQLRDADTVVRAQAERLGDAAYCVRYDDYVADPGVLAGLFDWLGEPFDRARVEAVLSRRHSY